MSNIIDKINEKQINPNVPEFRVGDTVKVDYLIKEGNKERIQAFQGVCISRKGSKAQETFTVRKMSSGIGVERITMLKHRIDDIRNFYTNDVRFLNQFKEEK